ncbi:radical SAM protein [Paraburkholderia fynbosensis]|uniref:Radical SAM core domain-containing protein n=1 Tax=Paraburkholderia fynbosensis TaxID=1200993 RepID=A0A6J5GTK5_9BURK|nr:radical SAM protein [Paraburkholderia fynbosensis]CAB3804572.1 hypothetical protein LMG27177_05677 [Paraburkholderia fynbosensis]
MYEHGVGKCHVELSTRCNAACPQCPRNYADGRIAELLPITELDLCFFKSNIPDVLLQTIKSWNFCGNYGDPAAAVECLEILEFVRTCSATTQLVMHSNGSLRSESWWRSLAATGVHVYFGIDGMEDTHSRYRRNTSWEKVIRNARAFIEAGGEATWQFIPFKHNEHQVDGCRDLAKQLGFKGFAVRRSNRFQSPAGEALSGVLVPSKDHRNGYLLEPPSREAHKTPLMKSDSAPQYRAMLNTACVRCKAAMGAEFYLAATGHVFPCCYLGHIYFKGATSCYSRELPRLIREHGLDLDALSLREHDFFEVIEGPVFSEIIPGTWAPGAGNALLTCRRICGVESLAYEPEVFSQRIEF